MEYPGDFPPTPEQRAALRLAANAEWLARAKEDGPDWWAADAERMMERDNTKVLADARKEIERERKAHKCYVCGRKDLPRWSRGYACGAVLSIAVALYLSDRPEFAEFAWIGYVGAALVGAAIAASMHEHSEAIGEDEAQRRFNDSPHM